MDININDIVSVKLTAQGKRILRVSKYKEYLKDDCDILELELWKIFEIFGKWCYHGCIIPFYNNIIKIM